jgi:hypothetical protein
MANEFLPLSARRVRESHAYGITIGIQRSRDCCLDWRSRSRSLPQRQERVRWPLDVLSYHIYQRVELNPSPLSAACGADSDISFYKLLFDEKWEYRKWDGPVQYESMCYETAVTSLMLISLCFLHRQIEQESYDARGH